MSYCYIWDHEIEFEALLGKVISSISVNEDNDEIRFVTQCGDTYLMYHSQNCCENVIVESIVGDLSDLLDTPILRAEAAESDTRPDDVPAPEYMEESETWTFYKLATIKGYVDIRWHGTSNGYYGESVNFALLPKE